MIAVVNVATPSRHRTQRTLATASRKRNGGFAKLRAALFHRVLRLPMNELTEMKTGGILSRLSNDVDSTTGLLQQALLSRS